MESFTSVAVILCALLSVCTSRPEKSLIYEHHVLEDAPAKYDFEWTVKDDSTENDFGHRESRHGYDTTGTSYVLHPDGRRQTVTYTVDGDSGWVAKVEYEGEAVFPTPQPPQIYHN